jgi:hypothetical protein
MRTISCSSEHRVEIFRFHVDKLGSLGEDDLRRFIPLNRDIAGV